jgi:hypothetical protein
MLIGFIDDAQRELDLFSEVFKDELSHYHRGECS